MAHYTKAEDFPYPVAHDRPRANSLVPLFPTPITFPDLVRSYVMALPGQQKNEISRTLNLYLRDFQAGTRMLQTNDEMYAYTALLEMRAEEARYAQPNTGMTQIVHVHVGPGSGPVHIQMNQGTFAAAAPQLFPPNDYPPPRWDLREQEKRNRAHNTQWEEEYRAFARHHRPGLMARIGAYFNRGTPEPSYLQAPERPATTKRLDHRPLLALPGPKQGD